MEASQSCLPVRLEEITVHSIQGFAKDQRQSGADRGGGSGPAGLGSCGAFTVMISGVA
jgi:hypothetical protein